MEIEHLSGNRYPGRGLVIGRSGADDSWLQVYWLMGRSPGSRKRRMVVEGSTLHIESLDLTGVPDASLVVYEAMLVDGDMHIVGNGDQVRTIYEHLLRGEGFEAALETREREPDAPNYTPRISGLLDLSGDAAKVSLAVLRADGGDPEQTERIYFKPTAIAPGTGVALHTYMGDGNPLPPFDGDPVVLPLEESAEAVRDSYWGSLDAENRVALAVKRIPDSGEASEIVVVNKQEA